MRIRYDPEVDALYLSLNDSEIVESDELEPGIVLDYNAANEVVGVEVLDFRRRVPAEDLVRLKQAASGWIDIQ